MNMTHGILKGKQDSREQMLKETLLIVEQKFPIKHETEIRTKLSQIVMLAFTDVLLFCTSWSN